MVKLFSINGKRPELTKFTNCDQYLDLHLFSLNIFYYLIVYMANGGCFYLFKVLQLVGRAL